MANNDIEIVTSYDTYRGHYGKILLDGYGIYITEPCTSEENAIELAKKHLEALGLLAYLNSQPKMFYEEA